MSENLFMVQLSLCISGPFTRCLFPMYCLHIIAKGKRKERRFKEGHDGSKFPIFLRFFCWAVLLGPLPVLQIFYFCSVHGALWTTQKKSVVFLTFPAFFLSIFLSFYLLSFLFQLFITSSTPVFIGGISKSVQTGCYQGRKITSTTLERFGCCWFSYSTSYLVANN